MSADVLRAAFDGSDAAWQQIVEQKDPAVVAFLQAARAKPARKAAAAAPVAPVAAPRPAAGRASVSPARQRLVLVGSIAGKSLASVPAAATVVAGARRPLQPSTEAQQAELALKQSMAALAYAAAPGGADLRPSGLMQFRPVFLVRRRAAIKCGTR